MLGVRREIKVEEVETKKMNGLMEVVAKIGGIKWSVVGVYVTGDLDRKLGKLNEWVESKEESSRVVIILRTEGSY